MARPTFVAPADAIWLHMEHPTNLMFSTGVLLFDTPLARERLVALVDARMTRFPRLRQRVVRTRLSPTGYRWEPDPHFDSRAHIHHFAVPQPGDRRALQAVISDLISTPLDRKKPLWHIHLLDGYEGGTAVVVRIHHVIADGIALVYLMLSLLDNTPDAPLNDSAESDSDPTTGLPGRITSPANRFARRALRLSQRGVTLLQHPGGVTSVAKTGFKTAFTVGDMLARGADSATFLKRDLAVGKHVAWSDPLPLAAIRALGKRHGGTINDTLLTIFTGALRGYLQSRGEPVDELTLRVVVPVALRPLEEATRLGNKFATVTLELPIDEPDPWQQMRILKERMDRLKQSPEALITFAASSVAGATPAGFASRAIAWFQTSASMIVTNVPGPRNQLYCLGEPLRSLMAWGPMGGQMGAGVTIVSYNGSVNLGVFADKEIMPDPERLLADFGIQFEHLVGA